VEDSIFVVTLKTDPNQDVDHCQRIAELLGDEYEVVEVIWEE
jgi:hypothetical protein